jgi:hypothetical protein
LAKTEPFLKDVKEPGDHGDPWITPVSPYHLLQRFLTFYCDCATVVTEFPVWAVKITFSGGKTVVTGAIDEIDVKPAAATASGKVEFRMLGAGAHTVCVPTSGVKLVSYPMPFETQINAIEDDSLILTLVGTTKEFENPIVVTTVSASWDTNRTLRVDGVEFPQTVGFSVERFMHRHAKVMFPVRTFIELGVLAYRS